MVYYRAGYDPVSYPSEKEWNMRLLLEESRAIKCPSISYHLLTTKKIQQVLSQQNVLEWYGAAIEWIATKLHTQI